MDLLTHTATGLFLSRAGLNRWTALAAPMLIIAAIAPDIDVVTAAGGSLSYLHFHRHLTHSLVGMPALAALTVLVVRAVSRKRVPWAGAFFACLIAVASHLLLDLTNIYGVRLLLPFSGEWISLGITSVVDLWIWGVFALCLAGPFLSRLVGSEIQSGGKVSRTHGRGFAIAALSFLLIYNCGRSILHARAEAELDSRTYAQAVPLRVAALPDPVDPTRWRGLAETGDLFAITEVRLGREFNPSEAEIFRKPQPDAALEAAARAPAIQRFLDFAKFPLWRVTPAPDIEKGRLVEVFDLRFGTPRQPAFTATALLDPNLHVRRSWFEFGELRPH